MKYALDIFVNNKADRELLLRDIWARVDGLEYPRAGGGIEFALDRRVAVRNASTERLTLTGTLHDGERLQPAHLHVVSACGGYLTRTIVVASVNVVLPAREITRISIVIPEFLQLDKPITVVDTERVRELKIVDRWSSGSVGAFFDPDSWNGNGNWDGEPNEVIPFGSPYPLIVDVGDSAVLKFETWLFCGDPANVPANAKIVDKPADPADADSRRRRYVWAKAEAERNAGASVLHSIRHCT